MRRLGRLALPVLLVLAVACGGDKGDGITDPVSLPQGSLSARIDGSNWNASLALSASYSSGILAFAGTNSTLTLGMAVGIISGPGTFPIGTQGAISNAIVSESTRSWHALSAVGSGSVTITAISSTGATGTFTFTAPAVASSGATGSKVVTNGSFNLKF